MPKETQDTVVRSSLLAESNRNVSKSISDVYSKRMKESIKRAYKIDLDDKERFDFEHPMFSWKKFRENAYRLAEANFQEANAENTMSQLLRAGINMIANNWYNLVDTNHEQVLQTVPSSKAIELYAPLARGGIPRRVPKGEQFPRTKLVGLDIQIANEKFGAISDFERELFDDDQTGQISQRSKDIGENMGILEDAWSFTRFIGAAGSFGGDTIPASVTYTTVWSTALTGGGANKPASYGAFTQANLQAADMGLMNQLDLNGNKMLVNPNTLLVGVSNKFTARALLNSEWYPSSATMKVGGGSGADSTIGTTYARNVMEGLYNLVVSRFLPVKSWAIGEAGKGIVFQRRDPLEMIQENPQSGMAFSQDVYQFRARARWEPDWIDPRFWYLGNDGSV